MNILIYRTPSYVIIWKSYTLLKMVQFFWPTLYYYRRRSEQTVLQSASVDCKMRWSIDMAVRLVAGYIHQVDAQTAIQDELWRTPAPSYA